MSMHTVNLDTYSLSLLTAKEDILNPRSSTNWALFSYDGISNKLKLADSGVGGVAELAEKFHVSKPQYGLCRVGSVETGGPRIAMISWVGQNVDNYRRTECAGHIPAIKNFFKEAHAFVSAEKLEDVTEEKIKAELSKSQAQAPAQWTRRSSRSADKEDLVGTNYRKTNAAMEMRLINRDSFWARAEREEEQRKEEERRRAGEERRRLERERVLKDRKDAEERDRKMNEKLQMIEEQRRKQAEQEEMLRRQEKFKWEQQQREHEDDMRARLRRSESIEKAAEAAVLVSQRTMNPREFFRQLSSSSSQSPTSPGSSRTGKPFRRYQRSLTDTAFIFSKAEESTATSPRSSPLVSPFSRAPPSPFGRATTSPPMSPDFRPVTSPLRPRAPASQPASPPPSVPPPALPLPADPPLKLQVQPEDEPRAPSPAEPSAPPASPSLLASMSPSSEKNNPTQSGPAALPASPPNTPTEPEPAASCFEMPQAPTAPLPQRPQPFTELHAAPHVHTELVSDTGYKVQAVLVEEEEEEEEEDVVEVKEEDKAKTQVQPTEPVQAEVEEKVEEKQEQRQEEEEKEEEKEEEGIEQEAAPASLEEPVEVLQEEEEKEQEEEEEEEEAKEDTEQNNQSEESPAPAEAAELSEEEDEAAVPEAESILQDIKQETVVLSTNGITNGDRTQEQNGIERSLSPSDTEPSSPEVDACYELHGTEEDDINEENEQEISENGQEDLAKQQMCVRALYDYQAEDESEISFEPGDIIRDVETVDKAWWRGWSKDGRQGLFPANYVETI